MCKFIIAIDCAQGNIDTEYHDAGDTESQAEVAGRKLMENHPERYLGFKIYSHVASFKRTTQVVREALT